MIVRLQIWWIRHRTKQLSKLSVDPRFSTYYAQYKGFRVGEYKNGKRIA